MSQRPAAQAASPLARFARFWPPAFGRRREAKASAAGALIALETPRGEPVWTPRDYASFAREGVMQNAIVYRSVRMIAEAAASVPLLLYERDAEIVEHPLLDLLQRPSPGQTGTDLLESFYGFLLVAGNAYIEAASSGGRLRELHVLRPDRMKVIPGADGWPEAFEYSAGGASVRIAAEPVEGVRPVLHMKLFHPANDHYGLSPIEAAATAIDLHNAAAKWNKALLDNSARPSGALVYTSGAQMTGEQFERLKAELEASFQGTRNAGRPLLLEGGLDWKTMSLSPRDLDFLEAKNAAAREIALAIGVPPMLLGIPGDNTYANYAEANRAFWRQTVLPLVNRMARALGGWLGPAWGGELRLAPDLDQVEALSPEREALWARVGRAEFLSDAEKRAAVGYGAEGGDRATRPFGVKYREDQARDEQGRWVDEGGGEDDNDGDGGNDSGRGEDDERVAAEGDDAEEPVQVAQLSSDRQYSVNLKEEEATGGHALRHHVGKSDEYLLGFVAADRVVTPTVTIARKAEGSFDSPEAANDFTNQVLQAHRDTVDQVSQGQLRDAWLQTRFGYRTGKEAYRPDADSRPYMRDTYDAGVFIRHDTRSPRGYRVHTAYPLNSYRQN